VHRRRRNAGPAIRGNEFANVRSWIQSLHGDVYDQSYPLRTISPSLADFDALRSMEDFFYVPRMPLFRAAASEPKMTVDLTEDNNAFYLKAEIPGVKKEDIHVAIDGNDVSISVETKKEMEEKKGETVLRSERYYGRWSRNFSLASAVDDSKAEAKYTDGVLMLTLPKKGGTAVKVLAVH
jgi:HSP20 family protein